MNNIKILNLIKCNSYDALSKYAYEIVKLKIMENPNVTLALPTGATPLKMYEYLRNDKSIDYSNVTTFNLDEYLDIDINSSESYHRYMIDNFFSHINIKKENYHIPSIEDIYSYDEDTLDKIDVAILGMGVNGHIAFNEPNTPKDSLTHIVRLSRQTLESNKKYLNDTTPKYAITMGLRNIMSAKSIILLVNGKSKKEIFDKFMSLKKYDKGIPVSILHEHPNVTIIYNFD